MTDKVQKIREEVERLRNLHQMKYQQLDADNSMSLVECGKRNLCNELLSFIDSLQKEPVSEDLEKAAVEAFKQIVDENRNSFLEIFKAGAEWQKTKDESCSKDLGDYINELSKQFPGVSFAKLSRIAVRVAKWQKEQMMKDATEAIVKVDAGGYPYIPQIELYDYDKDIPLAKEGEKYKVILIKEV